MADTERSQPSPAPQRPGARTARGRPSWRLAIAVVGAALAAGCAAPRLPEPAPGEPPIPSWTGRFAVTWTEVSTPPRTERASGRFTLTGSGDRSALEVLSPFGQTVARAVAAPEGATLETAEGRRYEAPNAEALTETVLGWRAPISRLPGWLGPDHPDHVVDAGWQVDVDARDGRRPTRMTLRWPAEYVTTAGREVTIRLILDNGSSAADERR